MNKLLLILLSFAFFLTSCSKDDDFVEEQITEEVKAEALEIESFIYAGMNEIYLYKADVAELADSYFADDAAKNKFLSSFESPEALYEGLQSSQDRFSFMTDDYVALQNRFKGVSTTNGMQYGLGRIGSSDDVFGYVQYVLPNTPAADKGIKRGDAFTKIDGKQMTVNNYRDLLAATSYTVTIAKIENGTISQTDKTVSLDKIEYTANPVYITNIFELEGIKIGYIMYNSFTADFDDELNQAFLELKSAGVTELVLDLRYNGGGSVESAVDLASMITGQFEGKLFMKEQWNEKYQSYFEENNPSRLLNNFNSEIRTGDLINSLNLSKVYVLTTGRSASASELVINGLDPYINVVQVGGTTTGKFQASVTLYDSPNFGSANANKNHTYAIQPLVLKSVNSAGVSDYVDGLQADIAKSESLSAMGILGDPSEPLLKVALNDILGKPQEDESALVKQANNKFRIFGESDMDAPDYQRMYIDNIPPVISRDID